MIDAARLASIVGDAGTSVLELPGGVELPCAAPPDEAAAVELMRLAAVDGARVLPVGNGSSLDRCLPVREADFALSTARLTGLVSHVPDDGTLAARAGTGFDELRTAARAGGHFLSPDVPAPATATLGGVVAGARSGPDRLRFGPVRDHVLGMRVLLANGEIARSGGQLVKNVTGFDLPRLFCGSFGTLGVVLEVALRLFPEPEHECLVTLDGARDPFAAARAALDLPARIVSLTAVREGAARWTLHARLFGKREPVVAERDALLAEWKGARATEGDEARRESEDLRDRSYRPGPAVRVDCAPSVLPGALELLDGRAPPARVVLEPGVASLEAPVEADALGGVVRELRSGLAGRASVSARGLDGRDDLAPFQPPEPPALALMGRLRERLDPQGSFSVAHFLPGLARANRR